MGCYGAKEGKDAKDGTKDGFKDTKDGTDKIEIPIEEHKKIVEMTQVSEGNPCSVNPYSYYARKGPWEIFSF